jgi:predicted amidohydrolase
MASVKITSLQMPVTDDVKANWKTIKRSILSNLESDWILTPECAMSGYFMPPTLSYDDKEKEQTLLDCMEQLEDFTATQRTGVICGTSWREADGYPYNQTRVYNNQGHLSCAYSKRLLTHRPNGGGELHHYLQGFQPSMFYVSEEKGILGSTLICNDAWATPMVSPEGNPYLISQLAQQGVKVIFVSANCNVPNIDWDQLVYDYHDVMLRTMAKQNAVWIVVSNSSLSMPMYWPNGDRVAPQPVDRVQVKSGIIAPNGEWLAWCDDSGEDSVTLDLEF